MIPRLNDEGDQSVEATLACLDEKFVKTMFERYNMVISELEKYMNESHDNYESPAIPMAIPMNVPLG